MLIKLSNKVVDTYLRKRVVPYFVSNDFIIEKLQTTTNNGSVRVDVKRSDEEAAGDSKYKKGSYRVSFKSVPGKLQSGSEEEFLVLSIKDFLSDRNCVNCLKTTNDISSLKEFAESTKSVYDSTLILKKCESISSAGFLISSNLAIIASVAISLDIERAKLTGSKDIDKKITQDTVATLEGQLSLLCAQPPLLSISSLYSIYEDGCLDSIIYGNTLDNFGLSQIKLINKGSSVVGLPEVIIRPKTSIIDILIANRFKLIREIRNILKYAVIPSEMELSDLGVLETKYREFLFSEKERQKLSYRPLIQAPSIGSVLLAYCNTKETDANGLKIIAAMLFDSDTNGFSSDHDSRADDITLPGISSMTTFTPKNNYKGIGEQITVDEQSRAMIREFLVFVACMINGIEMVGESGLHKEQLQFSLIMLLSVYQRGFFFADQDLINQPYEISNNLESLDITTSANTVGL